jgi:hypothetical protein
VAEEVAGSIPLNLSGSVTVDMETRLWGLEANFRHNLVCCPCYRLDLLEGFRFVDLDESLAIGENLFVLPNPDVPTAPQTGTITLVDRFMTQNRFYGGQIGTLNEFHFGNWFINARSMVALGNTHQTAVITGNTSFNGGSPQEGGLLAQASNIGHYNRNRFGVITDLGMNFGYEINDCFRVFVGYNFMYWSDVARPGNQINLSVNRTQLPGATRTIVNPMTGAPLPPGPRLPAFAFKGTDFWAHGVNFGLEFRY